MNSLGVERFLNEVSVGDEIICTTRDNTYSGVVDQMHDAWMSIQGDNLSWIVNFKDLTFYCVVQGNRNRKIEGRII